VNYSSVGLLTEDHGSREGKLKAFDREAFDLIGVANKEAADREGGYSQLQLLQVGQYEMIVACIIIL